MPFKPSCQLYDSPCPKSGSTDNRTQVCHYSECVLGNLFYADIGQNAWEGPWSWKGRKGVWPRDVVFAVLGNGEVLGIYLWWPWPFLRDNHSKRSREATWSWFSPSPSFLPNPSLLSAGITVYSKPKWFSLKTAMSCIFCFGSAWESHGDYNQKLNVQSGFPHL